MRRAEEMRAVFARFESSGLTLKAFGEREEIPYTTLQYWRAKLSIRERKGLRARPTGARQPVLVRCSAVENTFVGHGALHHASTRSVSPP
jgi:hypothetical protein